MSFFMITEGATQIEQLFIGKTRDEVVQNARPMINRWSEYECLEDQEIIELVELEDTEFDLVEIQGDWPSYRIR